MKKIIVLWAGLIGLATSLSAQVDYSAVTTGIQAEIPGIVTFGLGVAAAGIALMAAPKGVRFAKKMWAAVSS